MATALLTWELGAGTGHCVNLVPIARHLCEQGHSVYVAMRDACLAPPIIERLPVAMLQAPFKPTRPRHPVATPRKFAHILHNVQLRMGPPAG